MPGVSITIKNTNTSLTRTVVSDEFGKLRQPFVAGGSL